MNNLMKEETTKWWQTLVTVEEEMTRTVFINTLKIGLNVCMWAGESSYNPPRQLCMLLLKSQQYTSLSILKSPKHFSFLQLAVVDVYRHNTVNNKNGVLPNLLLSSCFLLSPVSLCTAIAIVCVIPSKINKSGNCLDQKGASVYWVYIQHILFLQTGMWLFFSNQCISEE